MVLTALAIVWVVVLGSYAKERFADHHRDSVSTFRTQLRTLQRTQRGPRDAFGRPQGMPRSAGSMRGGSIGGASIGGAIDCELARRRRKAVLLGLLSFAVLAVMAVLVAASTVTLVLAVVAVGGLAGYVALLIDRQRVLTEQRAKVHQIRPVRRAPARVAPASAPRRVAVASARR